MGVREKSQRCDFPGGELYTSTYTLTFGNSLLLLVHKNEHVGQDQTRYEFKKA